MIKVFEAFAGMDSQRKALTRLGIEHESVGISEIDEIAIYAYQRLHGSVKNYGDISKIKCLPLCDLFTYSFPCQDISTAGYQKGLVPGTRSSLLYECDRLIESIRPKYLLLENVKNLVGKRFKHHFINWLKYLSSLGYSSHWQVINALDHGVPQQRERVFAVSVLGKNSFNWPEPRPRVTFESIFDMNVREYLFRICPATYNWIKTQQVAVITKNDYARTLTTKQGRWNTAGIVFDNGRFRYISELEQFRLMGFDDSDYEKLKHLSFAQVSKLCGNSIVVNVLEDIFKELLKPA